MNIKVKMKAGTKYNMQRNHTMHKDWTDNNVLHDNIISKFLTAPKQEGCAELCSPAKPTVDLMGARSSSRQNCRCSPGTASASANIYA